MTRVALDHVVVAVDEGRSAYALAGARRTSTARGRTPVSFRDPDGPLLEFIAYG